MPAKSPANPSVIGQVALRLAKLPERDLQLVLELVDYLEEQHLSEPVKSMAPAALRAEARRLAELLRDVPREQLVARFVALGEEIRSEEIRKGTAIDGDWTGD